ncbi:MAG: carboxypeptidase regulatory-like domain-containing protein, partial [Candidatus Tyrphobacter sp.]
MAFAAMLSVGFLLQGTWALAGTTGGIAGVVNDDRGAPVADATVTAASPSQTATATTDAHGHFTFLVLRPDTYTITVEKDGYRTTSVAGETIQADQTQQVVIVTPRAIRVIAHGHVTAAALVKPGVGGDIYNVTPSEISSETGLGGGGNLESAYSAISSVPGLTVGTGGMGWNQSVVIHGENPFTTGFEYDGVPVNRAFDQYNTSTESSLGLQELQVYTSGGPSSVSSSGISGFINQVIKTGTYPGYATFTAGLATEAFYHEAKFEAGGATPDRNFSYYVGISGYDQAARLCNQQNCAQYTQPGGVFAGYSAPLASLISATGQSVETFCNGPNLGYAGGVPAASHETGCLSYDSGVGGAPYITDRENVINLHFGIPRRDGQRDDFQVLWQDSALQTFFVDSPSAEGPGVAQFTLDASGLPYAAGVNYPDYSDSIDYNLPFGTSVNNVAGTGATPYQEYFEPNMPTDRGFLAQYPDDYNDLYHNDVGTVKIQWIHPFGDNANLRIYAYSMFSDWTEDGGGASAYAYFDGPSAGLSPNYNLITHTDGGQLAFEDQVNDQNLLQFNFNYTTATTVRENNTGFVPYTYLSAFAGCSPNMGVNDPCVQSSSVGLISEKGGAFTCYDPASGAAEPCLPGGTWSQNATGCPQSTGFFGPGNTAYLNVTCGETPIVGAALTNGARYSTLWNGNISASYNTVQPVFTNASLSEEFRPSDKWLFDLAGRYENYDYLLPNTNNVQNDFYADQIDNYTCVNPSTDIPELTPLGPGIAPPPGPVFTATCTAPYVHPDGKGGHPFFNVSSPPSYDMHYWEARFAMTYTSDPDTVWRFSAGRYAEPPLTASVQYFNTNGNNTSQWANFMLFGIMSPFHAIPGETSGQYSGSFEHHFRGTDVSIKISPYYDTSSNWEQQYFIGAGYVTQIPVGDYRDYGVEASLQAGDFAANGFSGEINFTYVNADVQFKSLLGESIVDQLNTAINAYNCYTKTFYASNTAMCDKDYPALLAAGGASQCYTFGFATASVGTTCSTAAKNTVLNPYYNDAPQPTLDPNGWYPGSEVGLPLYFGPAYGVEADGFYSPYSANVILNWRHDRFAITPSLQFQSGAHYGSPMDADGMDPVECSVIGKNQGPLGTGVATTNNPFDCDYTTTGVGGISPWGYLYVPNPQTGTFATIGQYTEPSIIVGNIMASYDVSPRIRLTLTAASLWHTCFGGSKEPWSTAYAPGNLICGYAVNSSYPGGANGEGWYVGSSEYDKTANGVSPIGGPLETESYGPSTGNGVGGYLPF